MTPQIPDKVVETHLHIQIMKRKLAISIAELFLKLRFSSNVDCIVLKM